MPDQLIGAESLQAVRELEVGLSATVQTYRETIKAFGPLQVHLQSAVLGAILNKATHAATALLPLARAVALLRPHLAALTRELSPRPIDHPRHPHAPALRELEALRYIIVRASESLTFAEDLKALNALLEAKALCDALRALEALPKLPLLTDCLGAIAKDIRTAHATALAVVLQPTEPLLA